MDPGIESVIDNRGNKAPLLVASGFLLNQRCHRKNLPNVHHCIVNLFVREAALRLHSSADGLVEGINIRLHTFGKFAVKVRQHLVDDPHRIIVHIEIIGIREQIALQPVFISIGKRLEKIEVKLVIRRSILQIRQCTNLIIRQHGENLVAGIPLWKGQGNGLPGFTGRCQPVHQRMIIKELVQFKGSRAELFLCMAELSVENKQEFIAYQSVILQILCHILQGIAILNGNRDHVICLGQRQNIIRCKPHCYSQCQRQPQHHQHIDYRMLETSGLFSCRHIILIFFVIIFVVILVPIVFVIVIRIPIVFRFILRGRSILIGERFFRVVEAVFLFRLLLCPVFFLHASPSILQKMIPWSVAMASMVISCCSTGISGIRCPQIPMVFP